VLTRKDVCIFSMGSVVQYLQMLHIMWFTDKAWFHLG
jgi:hypothetical protein